MPRKKTPEIELIPACYNQSELAKMIDVTQGVISTWKLPVAFKKGNAIYHRLEDAWKRKCANLERQIENQNDALTTARTRLTVSKSEKAELEIQILKGKLIPIEIVSHIWCEISERIKSKLNAIPGKVGLIMAGTGDALECEKILKKHMTEPLHEIQEFDESKYIENLDIINVYTIAEIEGDAEDPPARMEKKSRATKRPVSKRMGK